jgi:hypothetical protein
VTWRVSSGKDIHTDLQENGVYKIPLVELVNRNFQLINVVPENLFLSNPKN